MAGEDGFNDVRSKEGEPEEGDEEDYEYDEEQEEDGDQQSMPAELTDPPEDEDFTAPLETPVLKAVPAASAAPAVQPLA